MSWERMKVKRENSQLRFFFLTKDVFSNLILDFNGASFYLFRLRKFNFKTYLPFLCCFKFSPHHKAKHHEILNMEIAMEYFQPGLCGVAFCKHKTKEEIPLNMSIELYAFNIWKRKLFRAWHRKMLIWFEDA